MTDLFSDVRLLVTNRQTRDESNQLIAKRNQATQKIYWWVHDYDLQGRPTKLSLGNGVVTEYSYDVMGDITNLVSTAANGKRVRDTTYGYNAIGKLVSERDDERSVKKTYIYDEFGRLGQAVKDLRQPRGESISHLRPSRPYPNKIRCGGLPLWRDSRRMCPPCCA